MAKQTINIGASANDGTGDPLRNAFDKVNDNFNEIYFGAGSGSSITNFFDSNGNLDLVGKPHKISFLYSQYADLPAASTYHGAVAHTHDTGSLYYAHGSWRRLLADNSLNDITSYTDPLSKHVYLANITNTETADYVLKTNADGTYTWAEGGSGGGGGDVNQNAFSSIVVAGSSDVVADSATDSFTLIAGSNVTLSTNATNDAITINASAGSGGSGTDLNSLAGGDIDVAADSIGFVDANDSNASKKESIADLVSAIAGSNLTASNGVLSASAGSSYSDSDAIDAVTGADLDMAGNKVLFNNVYSTEGDLPDASTYHGMFAHVHGTGAAYFAHSGQWVQLANNSDLGGGGGGGGASRVTETETTSSIADGASASVEYATLGKSFSLQKVTVDKQCWVRIYSDTSARTADAGRTQGTDPADGSGVIAEFIATGSGSTEFKITPAISGWLDDNETEVPVAIQNNSGSAGTVECIIQALKIES